jgi:hypothetical protein
MKKKTKKGLITGAWISVKDRIPVNQSLFLVTHIDDGWVCCGELNENGEWCNQFSDDTILITHWMPLPEPPSAGSN